MSEITFTYGELEDFLDCVIAFDDNAGGGMTFNICPWDDSIELLNVEATIKINLHDKTVDFDGYVLNFGGKALNEFNELVRKGYIYEETDDY